MDRSPDCRHARSEPIQSLIYALRKKSAKELVRRLREKLRDSCPEIKVLLVDDEVGFTASMKKVLSRRGFDVKVATDGLTALSIDSQGALRRRRP